MGKKTPTHWRHLGWAWLPLCAVASACEEETTQPERIRYDAFRMEVGAPSAVTECAAFQVGVTVLRSGGTVATAFDEILAVFGTPGQLTPNTLRVSGGQGSGIFRLGVTPQPDADVFVLAPTDRVQQSVARHPVRVSDPSGYRYEEVAEFGSRNLYAVWVDRSGFAVAGGEGGLIVERQDQVWQEVENRVPGDFFGATGFGPDEAYLVGSPGRILVREGGSWEIATAAVESPLHAADRGPDVSDDVWVVGLGGVVLRGRGHEWRRVPFPDPDAALRAVWVAGSDRVFVAASEGWVYRWDGASWTGWDTGVRTGLQGISGLSVTDVYATGGLGMVARFDGTTWQAERVSERFDAPLRDITSVGGELMTVGRNGVVLLRREECWVRLDPPLNPPDLRSIAAGAGLVFATASAGRIYRLR